MKAYKFLGAGRVGLFSDFAWPTPGEWVEASQPVVDCLHGVHAVRFEQLLDWIDDELWEIELAGSIVERDHILVAERGRLVRRLEEWDASAARSFADACALRAGGFAANALRRAGLVDEAEQFDEAVDLAAVQAVAVAALASTRDTHVTEVVAFAADMVSLVGGSRPEGWGTRAAAPAITQTAGATAANAAFVTAHAAGRAAVAEVGSEADYGPGFASERARQLAWFEALLRPAD